MMQYRNIIRNIRQREETNNMSTLRSILDKSLKAVTGISFIAMVLITCWQVLTRYVLGRPSSWSEELVSYLFAWASLLGASIVTGERGHMNIPILTDLLNPSLQKILSIFGELVAFVFSAVILFYGGVRISSLAMGQMTSSLGVAVGIFYIVLPVCGVLNMLYTAVNIHDILKGTSTQMKEED
jgi:TRAP-type C4-dicarboxylate transport system permease small subunit